MLDDAQKDLLQRLFAEGADLPAAERAAFVAAASPDDPAVQRELAELLEVECHGLDDFLVEPVAAMPVTAPPTWGRSRQPVSETRAAVLPEIEGYDEFEPLAEGGMGTVYRARQLRPVRREVAIKVIRPGMDSDAVLTRFEAERQALALMSHPFIASVYDAGTDVAGRPFIAMEFVDGAPITAFCEGERLALVERIQLFIKVCQAVDHAHRRGVLHRDLKPSNVLVARAGDDAMPKVIDFGIAKAMAEPLGERSIHTMQGTFLGTPEYMSPEQVDGAAYSVDTRSDVYSLGVMLYELLTASRPIEATRIRNASMVNLTRVVQDVVPPKPSTRLRELLASRPDAVPDTADRTRWLRRLRGDLDWIVMKALEKEPDRRYGSPRELAEDLERFLAHEPVIAGPPSGLYRLRKFTRRYRVQVIAAAMLLLSLVLGLSGTLWFLDEARDNERAAVARAREAEGVRLAAEAAMLAEVSPNRALLLALEASKLTDNHAVKQTVHRILPFHSELELLDRHELDAQEVRFLGDGRLLAREAGSAVLLWDCDTGRLLQRMSAHSDRITSMAVDPAERRLLTTSWDGTARVWDLASGECLVILDDHEDAVISGTFSPDGASLVTTSDDGTARIVDSRSGALVLQLDHDGPVSHAAYHPAGRQIATRSGRTTRLWDAATGALVRELEQPTPEGTRHLYRTEGQRVLFSRLGDRIVSVDNAIVLAGLNITVHSLAGELLLRVSGGWAPRLLGDERLLINLEGRRYGVVHLPSGTIERTSDAAIISPTPLSDGRHAIAVDARSDLCMIDLESGRVVRRYRGPDDKRSMPSVALHPDGRRFAVAGRAVRVWSLRPEFAPIDVPGSAQSYSDAFAAVPGPLVVLRRNANGPHAFDVWHVADRRRICTVEHEGLVSLQFSPCGSRLLGARADPESGIELLVFDLQGRFQRAIPSPPNAPTLPPDTDLLNDAQASCDGRLLAFVARDPGRDGEPGSGVLEIRDLQTGALLQRRPDPGGAAVFLGPPESGLVVLLWAIDEQLKIWNWRTGETVLHIDGPDWHIAAAISPDDRYLMSVLGDQRAIVWDLKAAPIRRKPPMVAEYADLVRSNSYRCGFLRGGELAWGMCSNEVHVFETTTGRAFSVLRLDEECAAVTPSADGSELVTVTVGGRCQRWPLDPLAVARRLAVGQLTADELARYQIGTRKSRLAHERDYLASNPTPRRCARLGELAIADGDLDAAIAWYEKGVALGPLRPRHVGLTIYSRLLELYCRRAAASGDDDALQDADHAAAMATLEQVLRCGGSRDHVLGLNSIDVLAALPQFQDRIAR